MPCSSPARSHAQLPTHSSRVFSQQKATCAWQPRSCSIPVPTATCPAQAALESLNAARPSTAHHSSMVLGPGSREHSLSFGSATV